MKSLIARDRDERPLQRGLAFTPVRGRPDGTLAFYEDNAQSYAESTLGCDMGRQVARFAALLSDGATVLDAGCGSGRDLAALRAAGFDAVGLDISPQLAAIAREYSGCRVEVGDLRDPPFDDGSFNGIWAVASLLHLTREDVGPALRRFRQLLVSGGHLFASVKSGAGEQQTPDGRRFTYFQPEEWRALLADSGFTAIHVSCEGVDPSWIQSFARAP